VKSGDERLDQAFAARAEFGSGLMKPRSAGLCAGPFGCLTWLSRQVRVCG
jgi:hypothetical protein